MFVVSRKRINVIIIAILISFISFFSMHKESNVGEEVEVTSNPVSGKTVILDAGHGSPDEGASSKSGVSEAQINLKITLKVQKLLEQSGSTVILTRSDSNSICSLDSRTLREKKISDIKKRVEIGNTSSADIFVSIHLNKILEQQYYGWQCFYKNGNEQSEKLAKVLQKNLNESVQKENDRIAMKINDIYIVKKVQIPLSIVECGFLSNEEEENDLQKDEYQEKLAWGIYTGIIDYFYE